MKLNMTSLASVVLLLQTALSLLALVQSNPSLPQSVRDNAVQVAQNAISQATTKLASTVPANRVTLPTATNTTTGQTSANGTSSSTTIRVTSPSNTSLTSKSNATIRAVGTSDNFLVSTADDNTLTGITLDGNGKIVAVNGGIIQILGSNSTLSNLWIGSKKKVSCAAQHIAGIYFITPTSKGNILRDSEVTGVCLGAIFGKSDSSHVNTIDNTNFHDNACNNVTFVGYGVLRNSDLSRSGWNCNNGIPGGSIYSLNNIQGGLIENNKVHDDCGNLIDLDGVQRFTISNNQVLNPGVSFAEHDTFPVCAGSSMAIVDSAYNTIEDNEVKNNGAHNVIKNILYVGDDNVFFSMSGPFSDLPKGGDTMMAFWLGSSKSKPGSSVGNTVKNNGFRAACTGTCAGVGYYVGRGSGTTAGNYWSAQTTNYFTGNDSYGSNIGSKRCGANWYAANSTCTATPTDPACNNDDFQHTGDWARNDTCRYWDGD